MIKGNLRWVTQLYRSLRADLKFLILRLRAVEHPPASLAFESPMRIASSGAWKKTSFSHYNNIKMSGRCRFLRWRSPSAAKEVTDPPDLILTFSRVERTTAPRAGLSVCRRRETIHHNYDCQCCAPWFWYIIICAWLFNGSTCAYVNEAW